MTMRSRLARLFARSVKALAKFWFILISRWAFFSWNRKVRRVHYEVVRPNVGAVSALLDELSHTTNMYHRRRIIAELRLLFKDNAHAKLAKGYPRHKHNDRVHALMDVLIYRYYRPVSS